MKSFFVAMMLSLAVALPAAAVSPQTPPDELVRALSEDVLEILRNDAKLRAGDTSRAIELVEEVVLPHFNFRRMTMLAVGRDWRDATPEQRERLMDAFYDMLIRTYSNALTQYSDQTVAIKPLRMSSGDTNARVQTEVRQPGGQPVAVDYVLEETDDGWKVFDIVVAGVSLVTNYRGTFAQEIRSSGIDGLIRALETRQSDFEKPPVGGS